MLKRIVIILILAYIFSIFSFAQPLVSTPPHNSRPPIRIIGDSNFTHQNGVVGGSGTIQDPYIIENWEIAASTSHGIWIENTRSYVIIRSCIIYGGTQYGFHGIYLFNVENVIIESCIISDNRNGINIKSSNNIRINSSIIKNSEWYSVYTLFSNKIVISNTTIENGGDVGIWCDSCMNIKIFSVNISRCRFAALYFTNCIDVMSVCSIRNVKTFGANLYYSQNIALCGNISVARYAVSSWYSDFIYRGKIENCSYGIRVINSRCNISGEIYNTIYPLNFTDGAISLHNLTIFSPDGYLQIQRSTLYSTNVRIFELNEISIKNSTIKIFKNSILNIDNCLMLDNSTGVIDGVKLVNSSILIKGDKIDDFYVRIKNSTINNLPILNIINSSENIEGGVYGELILVNYSGCLSNITFCGLHYCILTAFSRPKLYNVTMKNVKTGIFGHQSTLYLDNVYIENSYRGIYTTACIFICENLYIVENAYGIYSYGSRFSISNSRIEICEFGIFSHNSEFIFNSIVFYKNIHDVYLYNSFSFMTDCKHYNSEYGVQARSSKLISRHCTFDNSSVGIRTECAIFTVIENCSFWQTSIDMDGSKPEHFYAKIENCHINGKRLLYVTNSTLNLSTRDYGEIILLNCSGLLKDFESKKLSTALIIAFSDLKLENLSIASSIRGAFILNSTVHIKNIVGKSSEFLLSAYNSTVLIDGGSIFSCRYGVFTSNSSIAVKNLTFSRCRVGINLVGSSGSKIHRCLFRENTYGIYLLQSVNTKISNNTFYLNVEGVVAVMSSYNIISYNNFTRNYRVAIDLSYLSHYNTIFNNNFWYNNNASNNYDPHKVQVRDDGLNYWWRGTRGNFWSDWTSPDSDQDGIVDNPYIIDQDSADYYPLSKPIYSEFPIKEFPALAISSLYALLIFLYFLKKI